MGKKKQKASNAGGGAKAFFQNHVEKIVFGLVLAVFGYLVYDGLGTQPFPRSKTPSDLKAQAASMTTNVNSDHWEAMAVEPERTQTIAFASRATESRSATPDAPYDTSDWEKTPRTSSEKRADPKLLAPMDIRVETVYGALAVKVSEEAKDPLDDLPDAEPFKAKKKEESKSRGASGYGNMAGGAKDDKSGGSMGSMGSMGGMSGMGGSKSDGTLLDSKYDRGFGTGTATGMGGMYGNGMPGGEDSMSPAAATSGSGGGAAMSMGRKSGGSGGAAARQKEEEKFKIGARSAYFNVVTAVVPHEDIFEDFRKSFENAAGFNSERDRPKYLGFRVERVDVSANPTAEPAEGDWQPLTDHLKQFNIVETWAGTSPEFVDFNSTDPKLTMPIVPIMIRDYRKFAGHPSVPLSGTVVEEESEEADEEKSGEEESEESGSEFSASNKANTPAAGVGGAQGGSGGSPNMNDQYRKAMGSNTGGMMGGMMGGSAGMMGGSAGMMGGSAGMMGGMTGGYGASAARATLGKAESKYKLIRFYDFKVEPGKVYRYRVRVVVEDSNYPEKAVDQPEVASYKADVFTRVSTQKKSDEEATIKRDQASGKKGNPIRTFYRFTDWSAPSAPAYCRPVGEFFAGDVKATKVIKIESKDKKISIEAETSSKGSEAQVVFADFNPDKAYDIPIEAKVSRGMFLHAQAKDVRVVDPVNKKVKTLKQHMFAIDSTIVDVRGGEDLGASTRDDTLLVPGEVLVFRADGSLDARNELDDQTDFRMFSFTEEKEAVDKSPAAGGGGGPAGGPAGMGGGGGEGAMGAEG